MLSKDYSQQFLFYKTHLIIKSKVCKYKKNALTLPSEYLIDYNRRGSLRQKLSC